MQAILVLLTIGMMGDGLPLSVQPPAQPMPPAAVLPVAPLPHVPLPPVSIASVKGGYRIALNRHSAELFRDALAKSDEKEIAATLRKISRDKKAETKNPDDQTAATLEMIAFVVSSQLPGFKKSLAENMGPNGVTITLTGLQAPKVKFARPRPRLERALETVRGVMPLLPDEAKEAVDAMRAVARTTPLFWKVEPRP